MPDRDRARTPAARISRRRVLAGAGAAGVALSVAALGLAACDDDDSLLLDVASEGRPRRGGTLRTGTSLPLSYGLDPQVELATGLAIVPRVYGYLNHVDSRDGTLILDHAGSIEQPDATTYLFRLRDGLRFHDVAPANGRAVQAEDVVRSIARYRDNPLVLTKAWHATVLDAVAAFDERTVVITTRAPNVYTLDELGSINAGAILPREVIEANTNIGRGGAGSGPFRIVSVDIDSRVRITRSDTYHDPSLPYLDAMEWIIFASDAEKTAAFRERRIDAMPNRDKTEAAAAEDLSDAVQVVSKPSLACLSLGLRADRPPFQDDRVRRAIDLALDRAALIDAVAAGEGEVLGAVNPHLAGGFWSLPREEVVEAPGGGAARSERVQMARDLLRSAAVEGLAVRLQVADAPELVDVAAIVRGGLQEAGIAVTIERLPILQWFLNFRQGAFEATLISQQPYETPDVPTRFYHSAGITGLGNPFGFADPSIDRLVERSWGETDRDGRRESLLEAQRLMLDARPMLQLFTGTGYSSAWGYVRDRKAELPGSLEQYNYAQWLALPAEGRPDE